METPAPFDATELGLRLEREQRARQEAERVADETIRDLYERQCEIQLLRSVAFAANEARSIADAMQAALQLVCRHAGWAAGHVFYVDMHGELVSSQIWHDEDGRFAELRRRTESAAFAPGIGLPGHVLAQAMTVWIEDVAETHIQQARDVTGLGIRAAVGVPVLVGEDVRAVLELFREEPAPLDGHFVDLMGQVGTMLGRVIEREQSRLELSDANHRLSEALTELQQAQDRIVQQERLRALGQMASGIAHDFNNALHPIVGYAELLLDQPQLAAVPDAGRYLRHILTSATDAAAVVGRLREFYRGRGEEEPRTRIDLGSVVQQVVDLTRPRWYNEALAAGVRIAVETELTPVPAMLGHEPQLREAIINLVLNAVDAMPGGGTITLRVRYADGRVLVDVGDSGIGMSEEVRRQCLEPFFTTKGHRGSGLGLGMVYGIVRRHDGLLDITSAPGHGTTISLSFPEAPATLFGVDAGEARGAGPAPLRVLVVDDKAAARALITELLERDGHSVVGAGHGGEALAHFARRPFDVVLTDRSMPTMNGDELALMIKQSARPVPVIMITGFGILMLSAGERPDGVDVVLPKPVTRAALRDALVSVLPPVSSAA